MNTDSVHAIEYVYAPDRIAEKGLFGNETRAMLRTSTIDSSALGHQLERFCEAIAAAFSRAASVMHGYELASFDVSVELTAEGGLRMIASATTSLTGGLTLTFRKTPREA